MLKLSKKVDYGLILLSRIGGDSLPASAREIAGRHDLPPPMVANILKQLTAGGLLESTRGAQGGYTLARPMDAISLADVIHALEGPISLVECSRVDATCRHMDNCPTQDPIQVVHRRLEAFMNEFTLDEILPPRAGGFSFSLSATEPQTKEA